MAKTVYWTRERILEEAQKHHDISTWIKNSSRSHRLAKEDPEFFGVCTQHMVQKLHDWTLNECIEKAKLHGSARVWNKKCSGSYVKMLQTEGWKEICEKHYSKPKQKRWTLEALIESAAPYKDSVEWKKHEYNAYMSAYRRGLITTIFKDEVE